jgi:hypothetical protein
MDPSFQFDDDRELPLPRHTTSRSFRTALLAAGGFALISFAMVFVLSRSEPLPQIEPSQPANDLHPAIRTEAERNTNPNDWYVETTRVGGRVVMSRWRKEVLTILPREVPEPPPSPPPSPSNQSIEKRELEFDEYVQHLTENMPKRDFTDFPASKSVNLKGVESVWDDESGFLVGTRNETSVIANLKTLNNRLIECLEEDMRPEIPNVTDYRSASGFIGENESLIEILSEDNRYVVDTMNRTHQELALYLRTLLKIHGHVQRSDKDGNPITVEELRKRIQIYSRMRGSVFQFRGRTFFIGIRSFKGSQYSPFLDGTEASQDFLIINLDRKTRIYFSGLLPIMMERYGFYEGYGTRYRLEPADIFEVLDFLKP